MSSSDRRTVLSLLLALPAAACGFTPAYGPAGPARALVGQVAIDAPTDRNGFDLVERLEERLGRNDGAAWRLGYRIETDVTGLAITPADAITRYRVGGRVSYRLSRADGSVATAGSVTGFTSYAASGTTVSTVSARDDAYARLMVMLADQIVTRLVAASGTLTP
jgi:LPS-assembly lipoprotein